MFIPPQMIKQEVNREVARETNLWRSQLVRTFQQFQRDAMQAKAQYEKTPTPAARSKVIGAIGQLHAYLKLRQALTQVFGDNTLNQARGLIWKLTELINSPKPEDEKVA